MDEFKGQQCIQPFLSLDPIVVVCIVLYTGQDSLKKIRFNKANEFSFEIWFIRVVGKSGGDIN